MYAIWEEFARLIFHVEVQVTPAQAQEQFQPAQAPSQVQYSGGTPGAQPSALSQAGAAAGAGAATATQAGAAARSREPGAAGQAPAAQADPLTGTHVKSEQEKIGRNDPCWCGSGKKYKKCHGA